MPPVNRGWLGAGLDKLFGRLNKLPPEASSYSVEKLRIPVAEHVKLEADLYRPLLPKPAGTILVRSPYGIGLAISLTHARIFAARGYQVLLSSCRGTCSSDGEFVPGRDEGADGQATVAWMRKQPWYTGTFATYGASYLGFVQWALLADPPADMVAAIINTGPHEFASLVCSSGALASSLILWADYLPVLKKRGTIGQMLYLRSQAERLRPVIESVPILPAVDKHFGGDAPGWLRDMMTHTDPNDAIWEPTRYSQALERANIPIMLVTGWDDLLIDTPMQQYAKLVERGCNPALIVGPWTHLGAGGRNTMPESLLWFDEHLAHKISGHRPVPVRIFVTGAEEWRDLAKWPPPTVNRELYLGPNKQLSSEQPASDAPDTVFKFDPADPTPAVGVPQLFDNGFGKREDDTPLAARSDVATFTTEPLTEDIEVCGKPQIELHHSSDHPHVDLLVLMSEVNSEGISYRVSERYLRLGKRDDGPVRLTLSDCAHRFRKGFRIRVVVAGASHPRYLRNLGTDENPVTGSTLRPAWHTIRHGPSALSKIILPTTGVSGMSE